MKRSWEEMNIDHIRKAIDLQPAILQAIIDADGGPTKYMYSNSKKI